MALQTTRDYGAIEIRNTIAVTRAVHPTEFTPVGNWQLEKLISFPEQICLPFAA